MANQRKRGKPALTAWKQRPRETELRSKRPKRGAKPKGKRRAGRPLKALNDVLDHHVHLRISAPDYTRIKRAARALGIPNLGEAARALLIEALDRRERRKRTAREQ